MPFDIVGRTCPGMRQVVGFRDRSTERGNFGANLRRAIVTNGDFTTSVCDNASAIGSAVCGGACAGPRNCLDGVHVVRGKGEILGVSSPFSQWEMPFCRRR